MLSKHDTIENFILYYTREQMIKTLGDYLEDEQTKEEDGEEQLDEVCWKSAVEGLIKFHEDRIEIAINEMEGQPLHPSMTNVLWFIDMEYEA